MINPPRRNVTRFFVPILDVMILLFSMFLLLPITQRAAEARTALEKMSLPELVATAKKTQQQNEKLQKANEELKLRNAAQKKRMQMLVQRKENLANAVNKRIAGLMRNAENFPMYLKNGKLPVVKAEVDGQPKDIVLDIFRNEAQALAKIDRLSKMARKEGKILSFILLHTNEKSGPAGSFSKVMQWFQDRDIVVSYLEWRN